jgi:hypothetical protein
MLVGDFDYIFDDGRVYADVDYHRVHPHHAALSWTPAAGRGVGPQRPAVSGPKSRRPGTVPAQPAACVAPVRAATAVPLQRPAVRGLLISRTGLNVLEPPDHTGQTARDFK